MCRSIKTFFNFHPPVGDAEIREASLQFVRKISGFRKPSYVNTEVFNRAVDEVALASQKLLQNLKTKAKYRIKEN